MKTFTEQQFSVSEKFRIEIANQDMYNKQQDFQRKTPSYGSTDTRTPAYQLKTKVVQIMKSKNIVFRTVQP